MLLPFASLASLPIMLGWLVLLPVVITSCMPSIATFSRWKRRWPNRPQKKKPPNEQAHY